MTMTATDVELTSMLLEQADRLLRGEVTRDVLSRADGGEFPAALWRACEDAGLPLALVREDSGGVGLGLAQGLRLIRHLGYHAAPLPLPETILALMCWCEAGGAPVAGSVTLVADEGLTLRPAGARFTLSGHALRVPWGASAGHVLLQASDEAGELRLALLPHALVRGEPVRNLAFEPRDTLHFDGIEVDASMTRCVPGEQAGSLLVLGALMRAQQMAGAMERCLDYALAYAMERQQFGRPIAKFQAIQHMLAEAAGHYAAAVAAADLAADAWRTPRFEFDSAIAKARVGESAGKVAAIVHQVHGAMGFTQEHPLHFSTRRLWSWRDEFGSEAYWQERIGRLVCGAGGVALWPALAGE